MNNKDILKEIFGNSGGEVNIIPVMNMDGSGGELREVDLPQLLPILPLRNAILFPNTVIPVTVGRPKSIQLINDVFRSGKLLGAVTQLDAKVEDPTPGDIYQIGTLGRVIKTIEMPDDTITAIIQGVRRFDIRQINIDGGGDLPPRDHPGGRRCGHGCPDRLHQGCGHPDRQAFAEYSPGSGIRHQEHRRLRLHRQFHRLERRNRSADRQGAAAGNRRPARACPQTARTAEQAHRPAQDQGRHPEESEVRNRPAAAGVLPQQPAQDHPGRARHQFRGK